MSILVSLSFLFTIMMTFCKKSVHSFFLAFFNSKENPTTTTTTTTTDSSGHRNIPSVLGGLGFISFSGDIQKSTNVLESTTVKSPPPPSAAGKRYPGGVGFLDDVGGNVDGLMSCTESLGFESSDERRIDDQIEDLNDNNNHNNNGFTMKSKLMMRSRLKKTVVKREKKKFPPPLSSLNQNGKPTFFLRPVRKDGRLELTGVKIDRPEILRASRQDGRLRLHLIRDDDDDDDDDVDVQAQAEEEFQEHLVEEEEGFQEISVREEVEKEEERCGEWWFPPVSGGGDGFRRCHELVGRHHHHHNYNLHTWTQLCVTIR